MFTRLAPAAVFLLFLPKFLWAGSDMRMSETVSLSLQLREIAVLDIEDSSLDAELELTTDCPNEEAICVDGEATISFSVFGNTKIDVSLQPDQTVLLGDRPFGRFSAKDEDPDNPPLLFDLIILLGDDADSLSDEDLAALPPLTREDASEAPAV